MEPKITKGLSASPEFKRKTTQAELGVTHIISLIGEDKDREGLLDTPRRVVSAYQELTRGLQEPQPECTAFEIGKDGVSYYDELVVIKDIEFVSLCEHHFLPFIGVCHIGYLPGNKVLGLSKFARLIDWRARRPQIQERLTIEILKDINEIVKPLAAGVVISALHTCMSIRGVKKTEARTVTSALSGVLKHNGSMRAEFMNLIRSEK